MSAIIFHNDQPIIIAGPCSAESEAQVLEVAHAVAALGVHVFRAGVWKPRTRPGAFEGAGTIALPWLQRVQREIGLPVATEVALPIHVEQALKAGIDILWLGARTVTNPFAVQALADTLRGCAVTVMVKNPVIPDLELWIGALERLQKAGLQQLLAVHRGFACYEEHTLRNAPMWQIPIELHRRMPDLPLLCDPSHIAGRRDWVSDIAQQAMELCFRGLMVEVHCCPDQAVSDSRQQLTPDMLGLLLRQLMPKITSDSDPEMAELRRQIDLLDDALYETLARRMAVVRKIGLLKRRRGMTVLQPQRYNEILMRRIAAADTLGLDSNFVKKIMETVHTETVRLQLIQKKRYSSPDDSNGQRGR